MLTTERVELRCDSRNGFVLRIIRAGDGDFHFAVVPQKDDLLAARKDPDDFAICYQAGVRICAPSGGGAHLPLWHALAKLWPELQAAGVVTSLGS